MPSFTATQPNLTQIGPVCEIRINVSAQTYKYLRDTNNPIPFPTRLF